jgi:hypothetical protein
MDFSNISAFNIKNQISSADVRVNMELDFEVSQKPASI